VQGQAQLQPVGLAAGHALGGVGLVRGCRLVVVVPPGATPLKAREALQAYQAELQTGETPVVQTLKAGEELGDALARVDNPGACDVAWVLAGAKVLPGWRAVLQAALADDPALASVTALRVDDPWYSPMPPGLGVPEGSTAAALAHWLRVCAPAQALELGGPMDRCGVMRAEAVADWAAYVTARAAALAAAVTGGLSTDAPDNGGARHHWATYLAARGWLHASSCRVLVQGSRPWSGLPVSAAGPPALSGSAACATPEASLGLQLMADRALWAQAHPLAGVRQAVGQVWPELQHQARGALDRPILDAPGGMPSPGHDAPKGQPDQPTGPVIRPPVRLHIAHSWGGGLSKWVREFMGADEALGHGKGLVLRSIGVQSAFGQRLALYDGANHVAPVRFWELGVPIHACAVSHLQVRAILREIIKEFGVDQVLVSSLIGHSLDVLRTGLPTVVVAHDHHPFCITLYASFAGECRECTPDRLHRCVQHNPAHRFFKETPVDAWLLMRQAFVQAVLKQRLPIAAPSPSVARRWQSLMPALDHALFRVIPHGLELPATPDYTPAHEGPLRVVVLGRLSPEKGADLLMALRPQLLEFADVLLVGCGERIDAQWRHPRVTVVEHFEAPQLPALLAGLRPHVGLMVSVVPETFSYALSELWHAGIPVVATANGALADRIEQGRTGFLEAAEPEALVARLQALHQDRGLLGELRRQVQAIKPRSLRDMVLDYEALLPRGASWHQRTGDAADEPAGPPSGHAMPTPSRPVTTAARYRSALHVNLEVTWLQAVRGFWHYTVFKAAQSTRVPAVIRRLLARYR
jgi:glycosyltransferase involved in cell wall biosynthesis